MTENHKFQINAAEIEECRRWFPDLPDSDKDSRWWIHRLLAAVDARDQTIKETAIQVGTVTAERDRLRCALETIYVNDAGAGMIAARALKKGVWANG